jgi:hypothetical protein
MKVDLIDHTGAGRNDPWYAAALLIWTKRTRTEMSPGGLEEILSWPEERKIEELRYMAATIPSSWEFVDFIFLIRGVTRAFTHQLVRTRTASYAQQTMQVLRMDGWQYFTGPSLERSPRARDRYQATMRDVSRAYSELSDMPGVRTEDARGLLPTNILTNIVVKMNLRTLCDLLRKRASPRNQGAKPGYEGEWTHVRRMIKEEMVAALPWTEIFLNRTADAVAHDMFLLLERVQDEQLRTQLTKGVDQLLTNVGEDPGDA